MNNTINKTINQLDLTHIYRTPHLRTAEYINIFFSSAHGTFSRIEYVVGHIIASKNIISEITQIMFSDHNGIKLTERNLRIHKYAETTHCLNNQWIKEAYLKEIRK